MENLPEPLDKHFLIKSIVSIFDWLTQDTVGGIFFITISTYTIAFLFYSGYIHYFFRGNNGISPSRLGFNIVDIVSMIPLVISIIITVIIEFLARKYLKLIFIVFLIIITPFLGKYFRVNINTFSGGTAFIIFIFYFISVYCFMKIDGKKFHYTLTLLILVQILLTYSLLIYVDESTLLDFKNIVNKNITIFFSDIFTYYIFFPLFTVLLFILVLIFCWSLGYNVSRNIWKINVSNSVKSIVLIHSIESLGICFSKTSKSESQPVPFIKKWFQQAYLPVLVNTELYTYQSNDKASIFLVLSSSDMFGLYIVEDLANATKAIDDDSLNKPIGRLVLIQKAHVVSMEI